MCIAHKSSRDMVETRCQTGEREVWDGRGMVKVKYSKRHGWAEAEGQRLKWLRCWPRAWLMLANAG